MAAPDRPAPVMKASTIRDTGGYPCIITKAACNTTGPQTCKKKIRKHPENSFVSTAQNVQYGCRVRSVSLYLFCAHIQGFFLSNFFHWPFFFRSGRVIRFGLLRRFPKRFILAHEKPEVMGWSGLPKMHLTPVLSVSTTREHASAQSRVQAVKVFMLDLHRSSHPLFLMQSSRKRDH